MNIRHSAKNPKIYKNLTAIALAERTLCAAAHPFRLQLIEQFEIGQLFTAKQLAKRCRMPLERTRQHLRILTKYCIIDRHFTQGRRYFSLNYLGYERIINSSLIIDDFVDSE
ncbi:MAG: hypothetical protein AB8G22_29335 [Saprospiraceae bacterium]